MKHIFTLFLFCTLSSLPLHSQIPLFIADGTQGFGDGWDDAASVTYDTQENIYVTGYFTSDSIQFGSITLYNQGGADMYIVKYNVLLVPQWAIAIGGSGSEYGMGITADSSSNIVVVGNFESAFIVMGTDTLINHNAGTPDMFIARIDVNGNFIWARNEGGDNWDNCASVDMNPLNGDIYVAGAYYLDTMIVENDTFMNRGGYDMIVMKFDLAGNYQWAHAAGGNFNDLANGVAWDPSGNVYISGGFASDSLILPGDTLINPMGSMPEIFVIKYTPAGNFLWSRRAGAADNDHSVSVDSDGQNVYVAGHFHSVYFTFGGDTLFNQGMGDVFLLAYDGSGNELWSKAAGGLDHDFGYHVWVDNGARIYFSGMFMSSSITFGIFTHNNTMSGMEDIYMTMYNEFGFESGSLSGGGMGSDYVGSLVSNIAGVYMVGGFTSTSWNAGATTLTNADATGNTGDPMLITSFLPLGVSQTHGEISIGLFPNPGYGIFNFTSNIKSPAVITLYNSIGEEIISRTLNNASTFQLDITNEAAGIYFVTVQSGEQIQQIKLIKE